MYFLTDMKIVVYECEDCRVCHCCQVKSEMVTSCDQRKTHNKSERKYSGRHYFRQRKQESERFPPHLPIDRAPIFTKGKVWFWLFFNLFIRPSSWNFLLIKLGLAQKFVHSHLNLSICFVSPPFYPIKLFPSRLLLSSSQITFLSVSFKTKYQTTNSRYCCGSMLSSVVLISYSIKS